MLQNNSQKKAWAEDTVETYHGVPVPDPYRWLEHPDSEKTQEWLKGQLSLTSSYLKASPRRDEILKNLTRWMEGESIQPLENGVRVAATRLFFQKKAAGQNQPVLYMQSLEDVSDEPVSLLDLNLWSEDGATALREYFPNRDGRLVAYNVAEGGSDWHSIRVLDTHTGQELPDLVRWGKSPTLAWRSDSAGFYYQGSGCLGETAPDPLTDLQFYYHQLGTGQAQDQIIFEKTDPLQRHGILHVSADGEYLILIQYYGSRSRSQVFIKRMDEETGFLPLANAGDCLMMFVGCTQGKLFFLTDLNAPNGRIVGIDPQRPERENWEEVVAEGDPIPLAFITSPVCLTGKRIVTSYLKDSAHHLRAYALDGSGFFELKTPFEGSVTDLFAIPGKEEICLTMESFLTPAAIYRIDLEQNLCTPMVQTAELTGLEDYEVRQVEYPGADGTMIQMWLVQKKDCVYDGTHPIFLSGYGGMGLVFTPHFGLGGFGVPVLSWLEMGGIYAFANIRGGGEKGDAWHKAGMLGNKQNVFDDFIAAAEWLIRSKVTSRERLTIYGLSNGGLLTSACVTQRPDLYGTVIVGVPLTDMLRFHLFTVGRYWISEYGCADADPQQFKTLLAYSPYHQVKDKAAYPAIMVLTSEFDNRCVPAHAMKFTAAVQAANSSKSPILLRYELRAGHGEGKPAYKITEEFTDIIAFIRQSQGW
jgi:prolyl oligopeptidase